MHLATVPQHSFHASCSACALASVCLPIVIAPDEMKILEEMIQHRQTADRGEHIYRAGDPFAALYVARSGAVKSYRVTNEGDEQIVGFHLPGELFGLDGIDDKRHASSAVALESAAICEIPFARVTDIASRLTGMQGHLMRLLSREIADDQYLHLLLGKRNAEERIASLLISLSSRFRRRHLSSTRYRLPMSRAEMGNYLGLVIETTSRVLTRLQRRHVLKIDQREVEILDLPKLYEIAGIPMPDH